MALLKCKMCGGSLEVSAGATIIECEYCGTRQTLPKTNDENIQSLFNRANLLRQKSEFDKAEAVYEKILEADDTEAEAYWGVILCKFGIEYVEDPKTYKRVPTCHRTSYDSIIADEYYKKALENADATQRAIYEAEAKKIDEIQKGILAIANEEEPYDVFICYKETDENGKRTQDSVIANDIYHQLTQEGFKVFYAAITLEDKLGSAYEPIIFAALNSSKVMLSIGTKPEYFNAVWVKNEWSRFLKMMKKDRSKMLIPCYRDMDAYDLPEEFAHLQAQDMSKIGFINDVVRGITKVIHGNEPETPITKETVVTSVNPTVASLLKRVFMFIEDGAWGNAREYAEKVLDIDPENVQAYLGKLMVDLKVNEIQKLKNCIQPFDSNSNYQKIIRFGDDELKVTLKECSEHVAARWNRFAATFKYEECRDGTFEIIGVLNRAIESVEIPDFVAKIGDSAFSDCSSLTNVVIPDSVISIGFSAFSGCSSLTSITVPFVGASKDGTGDTHFGYIFGKTAYHDYSEYVPDSLKAVIITGGTSIGERAFSDCSSLTNVVIPDSVTSIGYEAFRGCSSLTSIVIPDSVTSIGYDAFYNCSSLTSIEIPNSVTEISNSVFEYCSSLTSVVIPDSVESIGCSAFKGCSSLTSIEIPNSVIYISVSAFSGCSSLTSIEIPNSVTGISSFMFKDCSSLASVVIPDSVKSIGDSAFSGCSSLTSIVIPNSVTYVYSKAFSGCSSLTNVEMGKNVTNFDRKAFHGCHKLTLDLKGKPRADGEGKPGCYVATCVYGSYDCPEVWTLRRFRDDTLGSTWYGRAFIHTYYAISPTLVKWFGHTEWFKKMWRGTLDKMVNKLNSQGVEDTPYKDKEWRK